MIFLIKRRRSYSIGNLNDNPSMRFGEAFGNDENKLWDL